MLIIFSLICNSLGFYPTFIVLPPIVIVLVAASYWNYFLLVHVLLAWLWMTLCTWDHQYPLVPIFDSCFFLISSDFSCVVCIMFPVPCWIRLAIVVVWVRNYNVRAVLDSFKVLLEAINWATISLSEKYAIFRLSSTEAKSSYSSAVWLTCWNRACVEFKSWYSRNWLYSNAKNVFKLAHVFYALGFLRHSL